MTVAESASSPALAVEPRPKALRGSPATTAHGLTLISAGAGSGKTHRLTSVVTDAVSPEGADPVSPEGLLAVTFTRKAAAEIEARIRRRLVAVGAHQLAQQLPLAYVGTVHAVCLRLIGEFAFDAGLSPLVKVISGDASRSLRQALEWGLDPALREKLDALASRLEIRFDSRIKRCDWVGPVQDIMNLARGNRIPAALLEGMAARSSTGLRSLLGPPEPDGDVLDQDLATALTQALAALDAVDDGQDNTRRARAQVQAARQQVSQGVLPWSRWIALQKLQPGKLARAAVAPLIAAAERVDRHPRLHAEIHDFTVAIYRAAAAGLDAYDAWKKQRRLLDFVDMVDQALSLVSLPAVSRELAQRLELVVVDEFQDTTPAQLALFTRLHQLARRSTWVGDRKQCIFEYAGADPALMEAVTEWGRTMGATAEALRANWRSRPELVEFCSQLFSSALRRHDYAPDDVRMTAARSEAAGLLPLPPLGVWWLGSTNLGADAAAIAEGVRRLLEYPSETRVLDPSTGVVRSLRPSDIAILVATNAEATSVTAELARRGIRTNVARAGLLDTPEGTLVEAALGCLADGRDRRGRAVVDALTGFEGTTPEQWLSRLIADHAAYHAARERGEAFSAGTRSRAVDSVLALAADIELLAPSEALDRVLDALDLSALCARWPDAGQRLANLDALRSLAARYERRCSEQREAASVAGLLRFFADARQKIAIGDEELATDDQHVSRSANGVTITTYHRSKGLEWPVVLLGSLGREERRDAFEVLPESDRLGFDPSDPLGGRWIRYYPWPYGAQRTAPLAERVAASAEGAAVSDREARERARLLYVGFTRARDHLILAVRQGKRGPKADWLEELCDEALRPLLTLPATPSTGDRGRISVRSSAAHSYDFAARVWALGTGDDEPVQLPSSGSQRWFVSSQSKPEPCAYHISPSQAEKEWFGLSGGEVGEVLTIGRRLALGSDRPSDWSRVGDTLHAFLAADLPNLASQRRFEIAQRLLEAADLVGLLEPAAVLRAGDQLRRWVSSHWPEAIWRRELPVCGAIESARGMQRIEGIIDLLLETEAGVVLIDHKSYPGARSTWPDRAREYAPQLAAYSQVLRMSGKIIQSQWIHFAVAGGMVRIANAATSQSGVPTSTHSGRT